MQVQESLSDGTQLREVVDPMVCVRQAEEAKIMEFCTC